MNAPFTAEDSWQAPFYELFVVVGPHPASLPDVGRAMAAIWDHPSLDGPYAEQSAEPSAQPRVDATTYVAEDAGHMYGVATLPDGNRAPCGCLAFNPDVMDSITLSAELERRMNLVPDPPGPPDEFTFYVPFGALSLLYDFDSEFDVPPSVEDQLDSYFIDIARFLFERVPFALAAIGFEGTFEPKPGADGFGLIVTPAPEGGLTVVRTPPASVDLNTVVPEAEFVGEDAEDDALVREMIAEARSFMVSFDWCREVTDIFVGLAVGGIVAVLLIRIEPVGPEFDKELWVIVGDLPPAYLVTDTIPTPIEALDAYMHEMDKWVKAVKKGKAVDHLIPVNTPPTEEFANMLESRLTFLWENILRPALDR